MSKQKKNLSIEGYYGDKKDQNTNLEKDDKVKTATSNTSPYKNQQNPLFGVRTWPLPTFSVVHLTAPTHFLIC